MPVALPPNGWTLWQPRPYKLGEDIGDNIENAGEIKVGESLVSDFNSEQRSSDGYSRVDSDVFAIDLKAGTTYAFTLKGKCTGSYRADGLVAEKFKLQLINPI